MSATPTAIFPDDRVQVEYGWISPVVAPDPNFPGIPVRVRSITKPIRDATHRIRGLAGLNGDGSSCWMMLDSAIGMVQSGRFFFVLDEAQKRRPRPSTFFRPASSEDETPCWCLGVGRLIARAW